MKKELSIKNAHFIIIISIVLFLCAHTFAATNLIQNGPSLVVDLKSTAMDETALGNWLRPFYYRLRGNIAVPYWSGFLSCVYLVISVSVLSRLFDLKSKTAIILASGILILNPATIALFASQIHNADASFLSILLSVVGLSFLISDSRLYHSFSLLCLGTAIALDLSLCMVPLMLILLIGIDRELHKERLPVHFALRAVLSWFISFSASLLCFAFLLHHYKLDPVIATVPDLNSFPVAMRSVLCAFYPRFSAYPHFLGIAEFIISCRMMWGLLRFYTIKPQTILRLLIVLALSFLLSATVFVFTNRFPQVHLSCYVPCLLACSILNFDYPLREESQRNTICQTLSLSLCGGILLGQIVFANQVYLKKSLEYQSTLSVMTRVLDRLEQTPGFIPGETPVALLGNLEDSPLSVSHEGFEHLEVFEAAANHYSLTAANQGAIYMWQILGYPLNLISNFEKHKLQNNLDLKEIPAFPAVGSVFWDEDTLVVCLST